MIYIDVERCKYFIMYGNKNRKDLIKDKNSIYV